MNGCPDGSRLVQRRRVDDLQVRELLAHLDHLPDMVADTTALFPLRILRAVAQSQISSPETSLERVRLVQHQMRHAGHACSPSPVLHDSPGGAHHGLAVGSRLSLRRELIPADDELRAEPGVIDTALATRAPVPRVRGWDR